MALEVGNWSRFAGRSARTIASGLLGAGLLLGGFAGSISPTASAASSGVYWGAAIQNAPWDTTAIDNFESDAGKRASIIHFGGSWVRGTTWYRFPTKLLQTVRSRGSIPMVGWYSYDSALGPNQPNFTLAKIASGAYDSYITQFAQDAKAFGEPFFLRLDHEMNGNWYPWSERVNGNQPGDYVRMWRHVHDIFTSVGATNVTWVWNPNISGTGSTSLSELYPGDSYVDWTGLDGYNWGTDKGAWQTFSQVFDGNYGGYNSKDSYDEVLAFAPNKPMMLPEVASSENGGNKANWITSMLTSELQSRFPAIKAVVWENVVVDGESWPIESSSSAQAAFKAGIASSYFAGADFGAISGKIQPLGSAAQAPAPTPVAPSPTPVAPSPTPVTPSPTSGSGTLTLVPEADTFINSTSPSSTAGGTSKTLLANRNAAIPFLRFDLSSLAGKTITGVTLELHSTSDSWAGSSATYDAKLVNSDTWKEAYMSYTNTTPISSTVLGTLTAPRANSVSSVTLSNSQVQAQTGGKLSLALVGRSTDAFNFYAREAGSSVAPQLVITYK